MSHKSNQQVRTQTRWHPAIIAAIIIGGITLFAYAVHLFQQGLLPQSTEQVAANKFDPSLEVIVSTIAAKFICACGDCGNLSLDVCTCPDAAKEREMIRRYLRAGQLPEQVIVTINELFGGLKPEFNIE
ncbi:MAG TPA: hypothetical protein VFF29_04145 [Bacteroidota bacterium]|nr:hypothetical protein [Bacteroidota bacterium]